MLFVVNFDQFFITHRLPLALESIKKGYEVHVACSDTGKIDYLKSLGITVHVLNLSRSGKSLSKELKSFIEIYKTLNNVKPNLVHFISIKPVLYGGIAARLINIPKKIFSISGLGFVFTNKGCKASIFRILIKAMYRLAIAGKDSHVIIQNPDDRVFVKSLIDVPTTIVKGSGVDLSEYDYISENNENIKVCMASRLLKDKGVFEYVEAVKLLKEKFPFVVFELYGDIDPPNPASLSRIDIEKIKKNDFINLYGFSSDIAKVFSDSNIIVLPSYREGLPKVLIEAAACGRAVVTTDVPGCRYAIEPNITGLLSNVKDSKSLSKAIEKLIVDNNLRNRMGKAGRKLAEREFDINNVVNKHFIIYHNSSKN